MQTVTVDILNNKAIKLLKDLEQLQLIRLRKAALKIASSDSVKKYKGKMKKQPLTEVDNQLKDLRKEWE